MLTFPRADPTRSRKRVLLATGLLVVVLFTVFSLSSDTEQRDQLTPGREESQLVFEKPERTKPDEPEDSQPKVIYLPMHPLLHLSRAAGRAS